MWDDLEERLAELDDLADLMAEPPVELHGRGRFNGPAWRDLESGEPSQFRPFVDRWSEDRPFQHGTAYAYNTHRCRCEECRAWRRNYDSGR